MRIYDDIQKEFERANSLNASLSSELEKTEKETTEGSWGTVNLALAYGGRNDIVNATKRIIKEKVKPEGCNLIVAYFFKHKAFIEKALCLLAFSVLALWRTPVRRRMQKRKIYLPFSTSVQRVETFSTR